METAFETAFAARADIKALAAEYATTQARRLDHAANGNERGERACMRKEAEMCAEYERLWLAFRIPAEA